MEYQLITFAEANDKKHKYKVILKNLTTGKKKTIRFGAHGMNDYTIYSANDDKEKDKHKERYINRHKKNENWNDVNTAGFWSRWILWNKETVLESLEDTLKKFKIKLA